MASQKRKNESADVWQLLKRPGEKKLKKKKI